MTRLGILLSGRGSNFLAIADAISQGKLENAEISVVISNRAEAPGIAAARARGRNGGAPFKMTPAKLRLAQAAMGKPVTKIAPLCRELGITRQTLYRHVAPDGSLREHGTKARPNINRIA